jgi:class 3 adenylate cyclase
VYACFVDINHRENDKEKVDFFFIVIFMCAYVSHLRVLMFRHMLIFYFINLIGWIIIKIIYEDTAVKQTIFLVFVASSTLLNHYSIEKSFRISFNYERSLNHEIKRTQALLRNLVPPNVFRGLLKGKRIADNLQNVTLLYTDMCGFTSFSRTRQPAEVVKLLSELFQRMDNLCIKNNVYKVHTIGDCYVVSGYTGKVANDKRDVYQEAINVIETGFDMLDIVKTVREEMGIEELDMRIGIHTGMMTAGIIGSNIVRYDIFGSDVLIANKMESSGAQGKVCVSEDTMKMVLEHQPDKYKFEKHVTVTVEYLDRKVKEYIVTRNENEEGIGSRFMSESSSDES